MAVTGDGSLLDDERVLQAFRVIDERVSSGAPAGTLHLLRERLAGELLGQGHRVAATLAPDFILVSQTGGPPTTLPGRQMAEGITRQGEAGGMLWTELDHLVADPDVVAGDGLLHTFRPDPGSVTTVPLAFFIRFADGLMTSEVAYMAISAAVTTSIPEGSRPSLERIGSLLNR